MPSWLAFFATAFGLGCLVAASSEAFLWSGVLLAACVAALALRAKWVQAEREYMSEKAAEQVAQLNLQRRARIDYLMSRHGRDAEVVAGIDAGEMRIGQTAHQLRDAYGEPEGIDVKVTKTKRREIWKYDQVSTTRFSTRITLDNGVVVSWDKRD